MVFFGGKAKSILSNAKWIFKNYIYCYKKTFIFKCFWFRELHGGSAYGCGTYASDLNHQSRSVSEIELKV